MANKLIKGEFDFPYDFPSNNEVTQAGSKHESYREFDGSPYNVSIVAGDGDGHYFMDLSMLKSIIIKESLHGIGSECILRFSSEAPLQVNLCQIFGDIGLCKKPTTPNNAGVSSNTVKVDETLVYIKISYLDNYHDGTVSKVSSKNATLNIMHVFGIT